MNTVLLVVQNAYETSTLLNILDSDSKHTATALLIGSKTDAEAVSQLVSSVSFINTNENAPENYADAMAEHIASNIPNVILSVATPATRSALGKVAAQCNAAVASNVTAINLEQNACRVTRSVYNEFVEEDTVAYPAIFFANPLNVDRQIPSPLHEPTEIKELHADASQHIEITGIEPIQASRLESANRIVGIGYGARSNEAFEAAQSLAQALDAELGASMNVTEQTNLMPNERYIGLSGVRVSPQLYIALGLSGSAQHLVGIRNTKAVVAINSDPKANFFKHADYGIVGKVEDIVPELVKALGE